jgi:2-polyprenyl-3-methyl-5-hydroxy-6-metoxy-1,4-benzoquinol methylase
MTTEIETPDDPPQTAPAAEPPRPQYDFTIDLDSDSTHSTVVRMVGHDKHVLELGPATGYMSKILSDHGCSVTGIEIDPEMASQAAQFCERVIVGDLDTLKLEEELGDQRYDVIVAADVLEHLKDPLRVVTQLKDFLVRDTGHFVVSLPNIAHGSVRLALLNGDFDYRDLGLLDRTHLRFFTRKSIEQLIEDAGLGIVEMRRQILNIDASEVPFDAGTVSAEMIATLDHDPDARTYQFVMSAYPIENPGMRWLQHRLREQELELERARGELDAVRAALGGVDAGGVTEALAGIAAREGDLRSSLIDVHDQVLHRDEEIERLTEQMSKLSDERDRLATTNEQLSAAFEEARVIITDRDDVIRRLRIRLDRILRSPPARLWARIANLPLLRTIRAQRTADYRAAVGDGSSPDG